MISPNVKDTRLGRQSRLSQTSAARKRRMVLLYYVMSDHNGTVWRMDVECVSTMVHVWSTSLLSSCDVVID